MEFTLKVRINATAEQIYSAWLSSSGHTKMTGGEAEASDVIGEEFSAWDGYISGTNLELIPFSKIVQSWRTTEFTEDEVDSRIEILLKEDNNQTELTLIHTLLTDHGEQYIQGWENHYFTPMKVYFNGLSKSTHQ